MIDPPSIRARLWAAGLLALLVAIVAWFLPAQPYQAPWAWLNTRNAPINTRVQAAWYQAVCNAVSAEQIGGGIYWWDVSFDANPAHPGAFESDRLTFLDRPAQQVIRKCFAKLSS